ncbi:lysozyme family protein [Pseudoramibacter alactolyticus]|uniref:lysozyme family protein n=1 Tax=Pseudoramibacter alactolyticus TaxID=113287 RepID=UPI002356C279|nr:lysozyme family protein [Pseudoramibacter alactolyticus]MBM6967765.1 lysozyme family protein [Pseudoramibacter alactolyticus]
MPLSFLLYNKGFTIHVVDQKSDKGALFLHRQKRTKKNRRRGNGCLILMLVALILMTAGAVAARTGLLSHILNNDWFNRGHLTRQVRDYRETIDRYTAEYQIPAFTPVIQAMMMQESKGLGRDPMQASESPHNVIYQKSPNSIQDPDYSIQVGTKYFAECLRIAGCSRPGQTNRLMLAIQGYNFGNGYIRWALTRDGGYSQSNAEAFSARMKARLNWNNYGDPQYAQKVMRYYQQILDEN